MHDIDELSALADRLILDDVAIDIAILIDDKFPGTYEYAKECVLAILNNTCIPQDIVLWLYRELVRYAPYINSECYLVQGE